MAIDRPDIFKQVVAYNIFNIGFNGDYTLTNWRYIQVSLSGTGLCTIYDSTGKSFTITKQDIIEYYAPSGTYVNSIRIETDGTTRAYVKYMDGSIAVT